MVITNVYSRTKTRADICMMRLHTVNIASGPRMVQSTRATIGLVQVVKGSTLNCLFVQQCNRHKQQQNGRENAQSSATNFMEEK